MNSRIACTKLLLVAPMRGRTLAVEQAGRGQDENARADRDQPCTVGMGAAQRADEALGNRLVWTLPAGNQDGAALRQLRERPRSSDHQPAGGVQWPGLQRADFETVPIGTEFGTRQAEDLRHNAEF